MSEDAAAGLDVRVRVAVYEHTLRVGRPPSGAWLAQALALPEATVVASLQRLADGHVLVLQPGRHEILMAAPFSAVPSPFPVLAGGQQYYGNCIWDALGILAMLGQDGVISTACGCCGRALEVQVAAGALVRAEGIAHFALPARCWWDNIVFT